MQEIELRPSTLKILPVCELLPTKNPKGGMVALMATSKSVDTSPDFMEESIFRVALDFQGKLEGEYKF